MHPYLTVAQFSPPPDRPGHRLNPWQALILTLILFVGAGKALAQAPEEAGPAPSRSTFP